MRAEAAALELYEVLKFSPRPGRDRPGGGATLFNVIGTPILAGRNHAELASFAMRIEWSGIRYFTPLSLPVLLFGAWIVVEAEAWSFTDAWILLGYQRHPARHRRRVSRAGVGAERQGDSGERRALDAGAEAEPADLDRADRPRRLRPRRRRHGVQARPPGRPPAAIGRAMSRRSRRGSRTPTR